MNRKFLVVDAWMDLKHQQPVLKSSVYGEKYLRQGIANNEGKEDFDNCLNWLDGIISVGAYYQSETLVVVRVA